MFLFQRSDINLRNQWSNYTNWPYTNMIPDDVQAAPDQGYVIDCPIVTNTVLDLNYHSFNVNAFIVVSENDLRRFQIGQSITITYDANNFITGTIINIIGTTISFLKTSVTTNAIPGTIYNNNVSSSVIVGAIFSGDLVLNFPLFTYASGQNYILQNATITFSMNSLPASISLQLNDNASGLIYISPTINSIVLATPTLFNYTFVDCFIKNNSTFTLQFKSSQPVDYSVPALGPSFYTYYGTLTGYAVPYSSGIVTINSGGLPNVIGPGLEPSGTPSGLFITKDYNVENQREILQQLGILLNGSYRENRLEAGVYNYVEKYIRTAGSAPFGLYIYNFGLNADNDMYQPSGAINMSKFSTIELEFTTYVPPLDPSANSYTICDPETGIPVGVNKPQWRIYDYNYDLTVLEERYNVLTFIGGNCALMYAR
jgi:hypothetical protein